MALIKIAVINQSTVLTNAQIEAAVPALQKQVRLDFAPVWGVDADLVFVQKDAQPPPGAWWLLILDDADQADALGYHELTDEGLPLGKVFAGTDQTYNSAWTVTASHELLEMLGDPDINLSAFVQTGYNTGTFYSYEVCDACEMDDQGYVIDGVKVSDFVYPAWFEGFRQVGSTQFDHLKHIDTPFKLLPGGYAYVLDVPSGLGWYQIDEPLPPPSAPARKSRRTLGSRRQRRATRKEWQASKPRYDRSRE
ncbi:MAG TPA: hypothetical protein VJX23_07685 [Candidatus Binataceae bacterium]|nr:hypothetical protein [Candidatus Binataceae bacterium]